MSMTIAPPDGFRRNLWLLAAAILLLTPLTQEVRAQGVQHKPEPWIVSVNHRIDLNAHARQIGAEAPGQDVKVLKPASRRVINLASGVLVDSDGHVVTRLVNLDPRESEQDIQVTTSAGKILNARFIGFDGPTGLSLLSVPELRGTRPAPSVKHAPLADGDVLRLISTEYKLSQISVPVERVALYPALLDFPARAATAPLTPALARAGVLAVVESAALTSSKDLSTVETADGRLVGIAKYVSPGKAHILTVAFLRDVVSRRLVASNGNVAAGWLGADGMTLAGVPAERRPAGVPASGVLLQQISPRGPAELAGLRRNDLIVRFDKVPVTGTGDLATAVLATPAGTTVQVDVLRDGQELNFSTVLGGRPLLPGVPAVALPSPMRSAELRLGMLRQQLARSKDAAVREKLETEIRTVEAELAAARGESDRNEAQFDALFDDRVLADLGLEGYPLSAQLAKHFGVSGGLLISEVIPGGIGAQAGLLAADVIVKAGGMDVSAEDELAEALIGAARAGKTVFELTVRRDGKDVLLPLPIGTFRRP